MKLSAKVIETISGQQYDDKQPRVKLKVAEADSCFRTFIVPNADGYALDDELVVLLMSPAQEQALRVSLEHLERDAQLLAPLHSVLRQLRPAQSAGEIIDEIIDICRKPSSKPRCAVECGLSDDIGNVNHICLYEADEAHAQHARSPARARLAHRSPLPRRRSL